MEEPIIKTRVVGVDISNAITSYAIVDVRGNIIAMKQFPTQEYPDANQFVVKLAESIIMLAEENGGYETIRSVGISCPSASFVTGCIENSPNLPWKGVVYQGDSPRDIRDIRCKSTKTLAENHRFYAFVISMA